MAEGFSFGERGKRMRIAAFSIVGAWIASVLLLGFFGYGALHYAVLDRIYFSLQLLFLHAPEVPTNRAIQVACFLAPGGEIIGLMLGIAAAAVLWTDSLLQLSMKFRKHVVVCGLGRKGLQLVQDFRKQHKNVLVIEKDKNNPFIELCDQLGAVVLIGDAAKKETLHRAHLGKAEYLIAACGEDGTNVDIAMLASQIHSKVGRKAPLVCFVHMVDSELRELLRQQKLLAAHSRSMEIRVFNIYENSARVLFRHHCLDHSNSITEEDDRRQPHLIVFGFGRMGESVVLQAARLAQFPNGKPLRVTVVDDHANAKRNRFLIRYPVFSSGVLCDPAPAFIETAAETPDVLEKVRKFSEEPNSIVTCVVAFDNDSHSISYALTLWNQLKHTEARIVVRVASDAGLSQLLGDVKDQAGTNCLLSFGKIEDASSAEVVVDEKLNLFAITIHKAFVKQRKLENRDPKDPSMRHWNQLDPDLKESNWQQAEHIPFKLRVLHFDGDLDKMAKHANDVRVKLETSPDCEANVLKLAKIEHRRWLAERSIAGWTKAKEGEKKNLEMRTHPDLKPWDELTDPVRKYDRDAVKLIPDLLKLWPHK
jgi:TrkA-N domain/RyR domain